MAKTLSEDGTTIAFDKKGKGPALILILGALNKRGSGKKLMAELASTFTVVSYDRRGRGDSTENESYSLDKEVEDIEALVEELGGSAYLYGHSSGAVLALLAAQKLGRKILGLALYELPYNADPEYQKTYKTYKKDLLTSIEEDKRGDAVALFVKSVGVSDKQIAAMKKLPMWKGLTAMAPTLVYDTIKLMEKYPSIDLETIKTSTLVMYGSKSPAFMADTAHKLSEGLPHAELQSLKGQAHDVKADALAPVLVEFFTK